MVYYRKNKGKGKGKGSKKWWDKKYSAYDMALKAWGMAKYIKKLINVESKFCDTTLGVTAVTTTGAVTQLSAISEGSDYNNRDGLSVKAQSIYIRGMTSVSSSATDANENIRLILFIDKESVGAPALGDLLENAGNYLSPLNHTNGKRFQVLCDKVITLQSNGSNSKPFKIYMPMRHHLKWYNTTTGTKQGHVYLAYVSDGNTAATEPTLEFYSRLRYIDN